MTNNIFDTYAASELREIFRQKDWPREFTDAMHDEIAYDLLNSWLKSVDKKSYRDKIKKIIENITYGYEDDDGNEMLDFDP